MIVHRTVVLFVGCTIYIYGRISEWCEVKSSTNRLNLRKGEVTPIKDTFNFSFNFHSSDGEEDMMGGALLLSLFPLAATSLPTPPIENCESHIL